MVFGQVEFKTAGTYFIEVLVDDVMKLRYPVPLVVAPPPEPKSAAAANRGKKGLIFQHKLNRTQSGTTAMFSPSPPTELGERAGVGTGQGHG